MHAIKVRWAGQPFALAKCNESEGRKTRIRRSKEERKAMVESFIKKYQKSNKGSFPSLNLTHKEVGGSFYTVREIVRDIIQENRVLGPGKLLLDEQSPDQLLGGHPFHSIAIEPHSTTLSSKEADFLVHYNQGTNGESIPLSDEQCTSTNTQVSLSGPVINGSLVDVSNNIDSDDSIKTDLQVNELQEVDSIVEPQSPLTLSSKEADSLVNYNQGTNGQPIPLLDEQCIATNTQVSLSGPANGSLVDVTTKEDSIKTRLQVNEHQDVDKMIQEPETPIIQETPSTADVMLKTFKEVDSIVVQPQSPLTLSSKEADSLVNYSQGTNGQRIPLPDEQCIATNTQVPLSGLVSNDSLVDVTNKDDSDDSIKPKLQVNEHQEVDKMIKEEPETPIIQGNPSEADVIVETFPLRPLSGAVNSSYGRSETGISTGVSEKQVNQITVLESDVGLFHNEGNSHTESSGHVDEKVVKNLASPLSERKSDVMEEALVELSNGSTLKECADPPTPLTFEQGQKSKEIKAADSTSGTQNLNETFSRVIDQSSKIKEDTEVENKVDAQEDGGSQKESIPTLNRLNLESWEGASKNSSKPEENPLLAIIKAFVAAFVKFWSE